LRTAPDESGRLARALGVWRDRSSATFVEAYREAMTDARLWPQAAEESARLLDFFLVEKALYEIEYELSHRPQWVRVPLAGILRVLPKHEEVA
jgi:maltose alpha-D-glucosyltransferase/alpha-amylase